MTDLPFHYGAESAAVPSPRRHRHQWWTCCPPIVGANTGKCLHDFTDHVICRIECKACGKLRDETQSRRGRSARARGNTAEREWCRRLGLEHVGKFGSAADGQNALFVGQAKSRQTGAFPGWMAEELAKLPRIGGRIPILGVLESPGTGHTPRRLIVIEERDWIALHGPDE